MKIQSRYLLIKSLASCLLTTLVLAAWPVAKAQNAPVPAAFQDLYVQESNYLNAFNATLTANGTPAPYPFLGTASLLDADANVGPSLINPGSITGLQLQLQALKANGVQAVTIEMGFPMLYEPFLTSQGQQFSQYVAFYSAVAQSVRNMGLKLIIENDIMLASGAAGSGWNSTAYLSTLSWDQYKQARGATAVVIAQTMKPDYLVVSEEPDYEAANSGQSVIESPAGATDLISAELSALQQAGITGVQVGAGVGTWLYQFDQYIQSYVTLPLNFIDFHIYPINNSDLPNALTIANIAASAGMPVSMTECWLHKVRDSELGIISGDQVRARDPFSFWEPLDTYFIQVMENLANSTQMVFLNFFDPSFFWAYLPYDGDTQAMTPAQILLAENQQGNYANQLANFSPVGMSVYNSLVSPADTTPPTAPGIPTGVSGNPNAASISWPAATDNVGVAGYYVFRNGLQVAQTGLTYYQDSGLTQATTYSYFIEAFDLGGNISSPSPTVNVTTKDVQPPSVPPNLTGTATSCYKITLTWSPSQDNSGVGSYLVFWGSDPTLMTQIGVTAGTITTYHSTNLTPGTTYYYAVQAKDRSGNYSNMSPIIAVPTLNLPTPPATVTPNATSSVAVKLTWTAGGGTLPVKYYHVFMGTTPSDLTQVITMSTLSYSSTGLQPATTYYYAVQSLDSAGDLSPLSQVASVTTMPLPTIPGNLTGTVVSGYQINLSWTASTATLPITFYHVYMGTSPSSMSQVGSVAPLAYISKSLTPGTTYYYAIQAADSAGDFSPMSPAIPVTTVNLPAPPASVTATTTSASIITLTWPAGTGGLPVTSYRVFAGSSPNSLNQIATVSVLTYIHRSLTPSTTYYYAVEALDSGKDVSAQSGTVSATTLDLPTAPGNVAGTAISNAKISVTWQPSTGSLPIASYKIYRSTTPGGLAAAITQQNWYASAGATKTYYNDVSVTPGTTYYYAMQSDDTKSDFSLSSNIVQVATPN